MITINFEIINNTRLRFFWNTDYIGMIIIGMIIIGMIIRNNLARLTKFINMLLLNNLK